MSSLCLVRIYFLTVFEKILLPRIIFSTAIYFYLFQNRFLFFMRHFFSFIACIFYPLAFFIFYLFFIFPYQRLFLFVFLDEIRLKKEETPANQPLLFVSSFLFSLSFFYFLSANDLLVSQIDFSLQIASFLLPVPMSIQVCQTKTENEWAEKNNWRKQ